MVGMAPLEHQDEFFDEPKIVSIRKLDLYGRYLTPWSYKLGSGWENIWVVDGFAGTGAYRSSEDGRQHQGSPRVAAVWAAKFELDRGYPQLRTINVESDPSRFRELEINLAPWKHLTTNYQGEFGQHLDRILERVGRDPVFFFLDPFGVSGIEMALIDRILERGGRHNEVLIHFSDRAFKRMAGNAIERDRLPVGQRTAEAKLRRLDEVMGTSMWRGWWSGDHDPDTAFDKTVELYLEGLRERFGLAGQVRMRDSFAAPTRYRLVFATRSPHGLALMSDIACRYERGLEEEYRAGQMDLFADSNSLVRARELRAAIHRQGLVMGGAASLRDVRHALVPKRFSQHTDTDYAKATRELVGEGLIDRETAKGVGETETLRFVEPRQGSLLDFG